uniref:Replication-associated protein n=1 Tax=Prunella montanella Genomoviridae sp. TaxID=2814991 RepID=A0A8E7G1S7_9VIRU
MTFILNARYFLVTYPQCDGLDEWAVNDHFGSLGAECIVAREDHADGGTHLHVFCDFGRKFRSRRADIFDVDGFHPNIERSKKNPRKGAAYACKDGDIVAGGLAIPQLPTRLVSAAQDPGSTLVCAESQREFFDVAEDICPWDLITKFGSFYAFARWRWPELDKPYESAAGLRITDGAFPELVRYRTSVMGNGGTFATLLIHS